MDRFFWGIVLSQVWFWCAYFLVVETSSRMDMQLTLEQRTDDLFMFGAVIMLIGLVMAFVESRKT